jgi:flagellar basal body-associated protein FliL
MLRRAVITAILLLLAGQAQAAEKAGQTPVGQYVDLQPVGVPIVVRGQLVNYVFVYVRVNLTSDADTARVRQKEPFFRDALVRMAHRTPFTNPADYNRIDEGRVSAALTPQVSAIAGPGVVRSVAVTSQTPQHRVANPRS